MYELPSATAELALPLRAVNVSSPGGWDFGWCAVDANNRIIGYCMNETQAKQLVAPFCAEPESADTLPCIVCDGTGRLKPLNPVTRALAERAVEAQRNDKRTIEQKIKDSVSFIMGPESGEGTSVVAAPVEPDGYAVLLDDPNGATPGACGYWYVGAYRTEVVAKGVAERNKGARVMPMYFALPTATGAPRRCREGADRDCSPACEEKSRTYCSWKGF